MIAPAAPVRPQAHEAQEVIEDSLPVFAIDDLAATMGARPLRTCAARVFFDWHTRRGYRAFDDFRTARREKPFDLRSHSHGTQSTGLATKSLREPSFRL